MTALRDGIDMKTYMNLYSLVHNFCTSQKGIAQSSPALQSTSGARGGKLFHPKRKRITKISTGFAWSRLRRRYGYESEDDESLHTCEEEEVSDGEPTPIVCFNSLAEEAHAHGPPGTV